ncbi:acyl-CoA thioesterase [Azospirillum thiophilum]|uniref:Acyl-CoA thioesterase n=2 Tax=Azospirillum thiophilum TaxID=528244 RepID=A0AAC8VZ10_9PROT|nr:acyl-CoA thioesterase [Azospirillum thiophilum]KJR66046.1 acyl-CoA thioesterase [Azospirillum thiophilum]
MSLGASFKAALSGGLSAAVLAFTIAAGASMTVPTSAAAAPVKLLALGDSLTAGYGLAEPQGFTRQLEKALSGKGYSVTVINAGVSGDTTAGGRARLDWALADKPDAAIVELGANDMLRGLDPDQARANLDAILKTLTERKIPTLLAGMFASPSLGKPYTDRFNAIYPDLAKSYDLPLYPFFLDGVALDRTLIQQDGLHPNAQGVAVIVERILPSVTALLDGLPQIQKNTAKTGG